MSGPLSASLDGKAAALPACQRVLHQTLQAAHQHYNVQVFHCFCWLTYWGANRTITAIAVDWAVIARLCPTGH